MLGIESKVVCMNEGINHRTFLKKLARSQARSHTAQKKREETFLCGFRS